MGSVSGPSSLVGSTLEHDRRARHSKRVSLAVERRDSSGWMFGGARAPATQLAFAPCSRHGSPEVDTQLVRIGGLDSRFAREFTARTATKSSLPPTDQRGNSSGHRA